MKISGEIGNMTTAELHKELAISRSIGNDGVNDMWLDQLEAERIRRGLPFNFSPNSTAFEQRGVCAEIALLAGEIQNAIGLGKRAENDVDYETIIDAANRLKKLAARGSAFQKEEREG